MATTTNAYMQALSEAERKRLLAAAQTQGAGAASSLALQMTNAQNTTTPTPQGATTPTNTGGAVPAWVQEKQQQAQANKALTEQQHKLMMAQSSGDVNTANQIRQAQAQSMQLNPYQAALAQASQPVQPVTNRDYLIFGNPSAGFKSGMSAQDQASWDAIGKKYAAGDTSWNRDTNSFREEGNWGSYYDANGNINGWLYAGDGTGGYAPAFGGKIGETGYKAGTVFYSPDGKAYTMGADGTLTQSGNVEWAKYGSYIGPQAGYQDSSFWSLGDDGQYQRYTTQTAPDEVLEREGYYRNSNGLVLPIDEQYRLAQGVKNGQITPEQAALAQAVRAQGNNPQPLPNAQPVQTQPTNTQPTNTQPVTNYQPVQTQPTQPNTQYTQNTQQGPAISNAPAANPYQAYMDQWDYEPAPEWEGTDYERQRDEALAAAGERWEGSEYQRQRDEALRQAQNMRFSYDPNSDVNWQALQKQYRREGDRATQEALAQASMRTGGLANSYAATAAAQAGNYYAAQLSDRLPQLYNDAYNRYLQEFQRQLGISDQYQGFDDREYSRWADQQGRNFDLADRYNQYGNTEYTRYMDRLGQYNTDRNFDYGRYRDAVGDYRYDDETQYSRNYQAQRDAISDQRYDQQWAQQLREYADSQNWKATEWDQYLREYGDKMSQADREWAYQQYRDAVGDARYDQQYVDSRNDTMYERARQEDLTAYQRAMYDQEYADERGDTAWEQGYKQTAYNDEMERTALNYLNTNGVVTGRYAEILGVPEGTTYEQYYSRYLGGSASGGQTTSNAGYSTGGSKASSGGSGSGSGGSSGAGETPTPAPSANYDKALSDVRAYQAAHTTTEVLQYIKRLINEGTITDEEGSQLLLYFGYVTGTGGGGSYAPLSPNNVLMTK